MDVNPNSKLDPQLEQALKDLSAPELEGVIEALALVADQWKAYHEPDEGLYLVPPYGEEITSGRMKCFVKARRDPRYEGRKVLVSGHKAYGVMTVERPIKVHVDEFDQLCGVDHCVERKDRLRWWPEKETLYLYTVEDFTPYDEPRAVDLPPGVQTHMESIPFEQEDKKDFAPTLTISIAGTEEEAQKGFSGRDRISLDEGLLIPLKSTTGIWMKDTRIPLTVAFLDEGYKVLGLTNLEPLDETIHMGPEGSLWALEASPTWFKAVDVEVGDVIRLPIQE